ncbi:MAG: DUF3754 domain-containing protein [Vitreimonas sp.]
MAEGSSPPPRHRDGFIATRKAELARAIVAESGDGPAMQELLKLLGALMHHEAHERLEALKALYDPLDPDAPPARRDESVTAFEAFEAALVETLGRANYVEIDPDTVQTRRQTKQLTGLSIKPSQAGIRSIRYFARGTRPEELEHRSWFGLRRQKVAAEVMNDVVVLVGFKSESEIKGADRRVFANMRGLRPGAALAKHFRDVAGPELVTLHPGAKPSMRPRDQVFLAAPAIATGVPVLLNLWPALTVTFAVIAAYFGAQGAIDDDALKRAIAAVSGLVAVGAFVMRQRLKYEAQTLRYQKKLADTVYFRNLANNGGVLDLLVGAGEEQDVKEAFLAYAALRRAGRPLTKAEIDRASEEFLRQCFGLQVDFDIHDALAKLERLGLVSREGEAAYVALAPTEALSRLDAAWDGLFHFSARR